MVHIDDVEKVVVIADIFQPGDTNVPVHARHDLELTEPEVLHDLLDAITDLGFRPVHYHGPDELALHAHQHSNDTVLSIYGGQFSRSRMMLVPAICESFGLRYVGLDAFGRALAQDKEASKALAKSCGLLTPNARVIRSVEDLSVCEEFPAPYVLKPLQEGSSIGIGQENLVWRNADGKRLAATLLKDFDQPVMMEAFVAGREISFTAVETQGGADMRLAEIAVSGQPDYFASRLFDADEKLHRHLPRNAVRIEDNVVIGVDWEAAHRLLRAVGHFGYARIDGRVADGRFHFIEFTPDAFIGRLGQMAAGFLGPETSYTDFIALVLRSAAQRPPCRPASD